MRLSRLVLAAVVLWAPIVAQQEVLETWPDGSLRERYALDEDGRKDGAYERYRADGSLEVRGLFQRGEKTGTWIALAADGTRQTSENYRHDQLEGRRETFHADGSLASRASWKRGVLHGPFEEHAADGRKRTGRYADGALHGSVKITSGRRTISKQTWQAGELRRLDDVDRPFPVARDALRDSLAAILAEPDPPVAVDDDEMAATRARALRRLQAYRHLCRLPYEEMELVAEWNDLCDAAAEVCAGNGRLSHDPPQPPGMDDERFRQGHLGASRSNLAGGGGMVRSVDSYMDDSDPTNIDRIGHRRWCLNPAMRKTGFGEHAGFSAMWSMDGSGSPPKGLEAVLYPPAGWVPNDLFGPRRAWSVSLLRGGQPKKDQLVARVRRLDEHWVPDGEPLELDWLDVAGGGYGGSPCIVFRPVGLKVEPGARYLAEVSADGGRTFAWRYVVAFCEPSDSPR